MKLRTRESGRLRVKSESTVAHRGRLHVSPESDIRIAVDRIEQEQEDGAQSAVGMTQAELTIAQLR